MTSSRLPKKVLLPLCGKTVLEVMFDRLERWKDNIIIATTNDGTEKPITDLCTKLGVKYYKGSTDNVLNRYYQCALQYGASGSDIIVRLTSDCPFIDPDIVDETIQFYKNNKFDYVSNRINRKIPIGLDAEVFNFTTLKESEINASESFEKEHVTPYIYMTKKNHYYIGNYSPEIDGSMYRLTLDEEEDYIAIKKIYRKLGCKTNFTYEVLINIMKNNFFLYEINAHVKQKNI